MTTMCQQSFLLLFALSEFLNAEEPKILAFFMFFLWPGSVPVRWGKGICWSNATKQTASQPASQTSSVCCCHLLLRSLEWTQNSTCAQSRDCMLCVELCCSVLLSSMRFASFCAVAEQQKQQTLILDV